LFEQKCVPIDGFEECVRFQFRCVCLGAETVFRIPVEELLDGIRVYPERAKKTTTHSFDKLFPILIDDTFGKPDLPKTNILVHLLRVLCIKWTPPATHLE